LNLRFTTFGLAMRAENSPKFCPRMVGRLSISLDPKRPFPPTPHLQPHSRSLGGGRHKRRGRERGFRGGDREGALRHGGNISHSVGCGNENQNVVVFLWCDIYNKINLINKIIACETKNISLIALLVLIKRFRYFSVLNNTSHCLI